MGRAALITGVTGQDGAYLAKFLLEKGCTVYGALWRGPSTNFWRLEELGIRNEISFIPLDLGNSADIVRTIDKIKPDQIYNLAAPSSPHGSIGRPVETGEVVGLSVCRLIEAVRTAGAETRVYQASTSELFGLARQSPQNELTPFCPRNPYGIAKLYAYWTGVHYRDAHGLFVSNGILFNHESPLRGPEFVSRKITLGLAGIKHGVAETLTLGNLDASRDWGFAGDYVAGMWRMLEASRPDDFVLATGESRTIRQFAETAGALFGFDIVWEGAVEQSTGIDRKTGKILIEVAPSLYHPAEPHPLVGDATKAKRDLGWHPETSFGRLVEMMVRADDDRVMRSLRGA